MGDRYRNRGQFTSVWFTRQTGKLVVEVVKKLVKKDREPYLRITWGRTNPPNKFVAIAPRFVVTPTRYASRPLFISARSRNPGLAYSTAVQGISSDFDSDQESHGSGHKSIQ